MRAGEAARVIYEEQQIPRDLLAYVIAEPVQGEGGYLIGQPRFINGLVDFAHHYNALYISDEVQTGLGRTGRFWAIEHFGVRPDVIVAAKALRVGAVVSTKEIFPQTPGVISSTWAGGAVAAAVAVTTLEVIESEDLIGNAGAMGGEALAMLAALAGRQAAVSNVRGLGLMLAFDLPSPAIRDAVVQACFRRGLLLLGCGSRSIRLLPPLDVRPREIAMARQVMEAAIGAVVRDAEGAPR